MYAPALMAFLHHLAAFTVVAALAVEVALFRPPLSLQQARRLLRTDIIFGASAAAVLIVGMLRVEFFEKGPAYYWHDTFFLTKFTAFLLAALISIYPTLTFLSWNSLLRSGTAPEVSAQRTRSVRMCLMLELTAIVVILACAALMARGFGYVPAAASTPGARG
jgi:putative membrane protein